MRFGMARAWTSAALGFALVLALAVGPARAGGEPLQLYHHGEPPAPAPRWSNDHHIAGPAEDCAGQPLYDSPHYVPGVDAWGRPVVELIRPYADRRLMPLPYGELDYNLYGIPAGKYELGIGVRGHPPALPHGAYGPGGRDCLPSFK